jgi:hypothetical protein
MFKFETLTQARKLTVAVQKLLGRKLMEDADSDTVDAMQLLSMEWSRLPADSAAPQRKFFACERITIGCLVVEDFWFSEAGDMSRP